MRSGLQNKIVARDDISHHENLPKKKLGGLKDPRVFLYLTFWLIITTTATTTATF